MDDFVAERFLGWTREAEGWRDREGGLRPAVPAYSADVGAAWEIVDRVLERGFKLQLTGSRIWQARFYKSVAHTLDTRAFEATGRNAAEAVCLAALASEGIEVPKR